MPISRGNIAPNIGSVVALDNIGAYYDLGHAVPQDYAQAMAWYTKAATSGNAMAMRHIAVLYETGHGVPPNPTQAAAWRQKAADAGDAASKKWIAEHGK